MALLLELLELARLELPRALREAEHRKALQGVSEETYGWGLPITRLHASGIQEYALREVAERFSFEVVDAIDYDELRPGYAVEAVQWVVDRGGLGPESMVVDLASGTGQLARLLLPMGLDVVAVEPAANMRTRLTERFPAVRVLDGAAEALPCADGVVGAVVVGNAFHHFNRDLAFAEVHRVLVPQAPLALFWAWPLEEEQLRIAGIGELHDLAEQTLAASGIATAYRSWGEPPAQARGFGPFERREFPLTHVIPSVRLADLWATSSDVASLPLERRDAFLDQIRRLSDALPETLHLPARTVVDLCMRAEQV